MAEEQMKLEFTGRGSVLIETTNYGPIVFDFDDEMIAAMLMKVFLENCEDGVPMRAYSEEEKKVIHAVLDQVHTQSDGDSREPNEI